MELDTNILQTNTVKTIVKVLKEVETELVIPKNKQKIDEIINRHEVALSLIGSYRDKI